MKSAEVSTKFTVGGTRCFIGKGYSEQDCSQSFDTFEEADEHRIEYHAVPEHCYITKITTEYFEVEKGASDE